MRLNPAVSALTAPPVAIVQDWTSRYDGRRGPLINMSQAAPEYPAHDGMLAALGKAAADPANLGYGPILGEPPLREAYARHCSLVYGADVDPGEVMIASGCNQAFVLAALAVAGAGDAVLMPNPCYFNHASTLGMAGVRVDMAETTEELGFVPDPSAIAAAITPETRAVALVSPNNPTGAVYPDSVLQAIADLCGRHGLWLLLDETYRDFMAPGAPPHGLLERGDWRERVILLYSFSKAYAMPGHRLGALVAGREAMEGIEKVMDNLQICAPRAAQAAVAPMIGKLADWREANRAAIEGRGAAFAEAMSGLDGWEVSSMGAFFGYTRHPFEMDSTAVAEYLVREAGVLTIPGAFFGGGQERFLRIAFANAGLDEIGQLKDRLEGAAP